MFFISQLHHWVAHSRRGNVDSAYIMEVDDDHEFGIKELSSGMPAPTIDIVAIHGLNGHRERSWTAKNGNLWLKDFLPERIPTARILSYGYDAYTNSSCTQDLDDRATNLLAKVSLARRTSGTGCDSESEKRPIIFIAHSLGGIILKRALVQASAAHEEHLLHHKQIYLSTYGIMFLGTPHQGTHAVSEFSPFYSQRHDSLMKDLRPHSQFLQTLIKDFTPIASKFHTISFHETLPTNSMLVVSRHSAVVPGAINVEHIGLHKRHFDMCKFEAMHDDDCNAVVSHLKLMVDKALEGTRGQGTTGPSSSALDDPRMDANFEVTSTLGKRKRELSQDGPEPYVNRRCTLYRQDFVLLRTISSFTVRHSDRSPSLCNPDHVEPWTVNVQLSEAKRKADGEIVLVKVYEGQPSSRGSRNIPFQDDLKCYQDVWHANILQFLGNSNAQDNVLFQVFSNPGSDPEDAYNWLQRTMASGLGETLQGLYGMRDSINALKQFAEKWELSRYPFDSPGLATVVTIDGPGNRHRLKLVYSGNIYSGGHAWSWPFSNEPRDVPDRSSLTFLLEEFYGHSREWLHGATLMDQFPSSCNNHQAANYLLNHGFLIEGWTTVACPLMRASLGDVLYINPITGLYTVVGNIHEWLSDVMNEEDLEPEVGLDYNEAHLLESMEIQGGKVIRNTFDVSLPYGKYPGSVTVELSYIVDHAHVVKAWRSYAPLFLEQRKLRRVRPHELMIVWAINEFFDFDTPDIPPSGVDESIMYSFELNSPQYTSGPFGGYIPDLQMCYSYDAEPSWINDAVWPYSARPNDHDFNRSVSFWQLPRCIWEDD